MPIAIVCPGCSAKLNAPDAAGKKIKCPKCQAVLTVPAATGETGVTKAPKPASRRDKDDEEAVTAKPRKAAPVDDDEDDDRPRSRRRRDDGEEEEDRRPAKSSGKAMASLVLGIFSFCLPGLAALPALILGFLALGDIKRAKGRLAGRGLAITGIILSIAGTVVSAVAILIGVIGLGLLVPAAARVQQAAGQQHARNNLKEIGVAFHNHHDVFNQLPHAAKTSPKGEPLLSWRVTVLPFIEQDGLFRQFNQGVRWDMAPNNALLSQTPAAYRGGGDPTQTLVQVCTGPSTLFPDNKKPMRFANIPDGTSNTIMIVQAANTPVPWTKPADIPLVPNQPLPAQLQGQQLSVVMADGSTRTIDRTRIDDRVLRLLIDPRDGQVVPLP